MKKIEQFNYQLNNSVTFSNKRQKMYKEQVMRVCSNLMKKIEEKDKMCIIGAGRLNDLDIMMFLRFFNEVVLTDIDIASTKDTLKKMNLNYQQQSTINVMRTEYTGFELNHFFDNFKERIVNCHTFEKIEQVLNSLLDGLDRYKFLKDYQNSFDLVIVSPIYTQLIYNQVLRECSMLRESGYPEHLIKYIEDFMLDEMINVITRFNNNIINTVKEEGYLFVLSDVFEVDNKSDFYRRVEYVIGNYDVMEEIYEGYKKNYGMGLGDFGLYHLDENVDSTLSKWLIWPYTENRSFIVKLKIFIKKT